MIEVNTLTRHRASRAIASDGVPIAYEDIGHGEPLVLLHGLTENGESWHEAGYVDTFLRRGYRLILIDCRGHGRSGKPRDPSAYGGRRLASDVTAVLDNAGVQFASLFGYSMGAVAAMATAIYYPHRVKALVCHGAHPFAEDLSPFRAALQDGFSAWLRFLKGLQPDLSLPTTRRIEANDLAAIQAGLNKDRPDFSAAFAGLPIALLAIAGTADPRLPLIRDFAVLADGEFLPLAGKNHVTAFTDVGSVVPAVDDFLVRARAFAWGRD